MGTFDRVSASIFTHDTGHAAARVRELNAQQAANNIQTEKDLDDAYAAAGKTRPPKGKGNR
jgi:hypothetical protein